MKHLKIASIAAACALALSLALVGCSGSGSEASNGAQGSNEAADASTNANGLAVFWTLDEGAPEILDAYMYLEDDSAMIVVGDWGYEGTWSVDGSNVTINLDEGAGQLKLAKDGDRLVLGSDSGTRLVFVPGDEEAYFADAMEDIEATGDESTELVEEVITDIEPVTVADDANVTITVDGKGTDSTGDPVYRLSVVNKTDKALYLYAGDAFKVGDVEVEGYGTTGISLDPNATTVEELYFSADELGGGADKLANVTGTIILADFDTDEDIATYQISL